MESKQDKLTDLKALLKDLGGAVIAFSGGVDSTFLAKVASDVLGNNILAVTAGSSLYPQKETTAALKLARQLGFSHLAIQTEELDDEQFAANPPSRCYICKLELFNRLLAIAHRYALPFVLDGANSDDLCDWRPGRQAALELGIKSPLQEVGLTKQEIRELARKMKIPNWNKPSLACLASRLPYGERITPEKLTAIAQAEEYLSSIGLGQLRLRHHGVLARIEVEPGDFPVVLGQADSIAGHLKKLGYNYVTLDLQGYRTGSLNEVLDK